MTMPNEPNAPVSESAVSTPATDQPNTNPTTPQPPMTDRVRKFIKKDRPSGQRSTGKVPTLNVQDLPAAPRLRDLDKDIESEMEAAMSEFSGEKLLAEPEKPTLAQPTDASGKKRGTILSIHGADVFIDVPGGRTQGVMPILQFDNPPKIGDVVEFMIEGFDGANGLLKLTKAGAAKIVDWASVSKGVIVEARVTATNKGGLAVEVNGIAGFMPFSEIDLYRTENPEALVNQRLVCEVTRVEPERRNLIVSRRIILEREREEAQKRFWNTVELGQVLSGTVRAIKEFGAFIDLGGADGLLPVSEISWARVGNPNDVLKVGQKVEVKVTKLDPVNRKLTLSLKELTTSPWETFSERYPIGSRIQGRITRTMEFGAFLEIEPGIEGLIHISELSTNRVRRVRDVVQENQVVEAEILSVDRESKRISLSIRAIAASKQQEENAAAMAELEARQEQEQATTETTEKKPVKHNFQYKGGLG